jgi:hypothetical protein
MFPFVPDNCPAPLPLPASVLLLKIECTREELFDLLDNRKDGRASLELDNPTLRKPEFIEVWRENDCRPDLFTGGPAESVIGLLLFLGENGRELTMPVRGDATFEFSSTALDFEDTFKGTPERRPATECDGRNFTFVVSAVLKEFSLEIDRGVELLYAGNDVVPLSDLPASGILNEPSLVYEGLAELFICGRTPQPSALIVS